MQALKHRSAAAVAALAALVLAAATVVADARAAHAADTHSISGTVTLPAGEPAHMYQGVQVYVSQAGGGISSSATPASDGTYSLGGLPAGQYRVQFSAVPLPASDPVVTPEYVTEFYPGVYQQQNAGLVDLTAGSATGIDATLEWASTLSGKVTIASALNADWVKGVTVKAWSANGASGSAVPNAATGAYELTGLPTGAYTVQFSVGSYFDGGVVLPDLLTEYYNDVYGPSAATLVTLPAHGAAGGINATLSNVGHFTSSPKPTIVLSKLTVGSTLGSKTGVWVPTPAKITYQWKRNGVAISGATKATYKITTKDRGKKITLTTTATLSKFTTKSATSAAVLIPKPFSKTATPKITGTLKVGKKLSVTKGTWSPKPSFSYQWYRDGKKISGATKSTYTVKAADKGKKIKVKVTAKKSGYITVSKTSASKKIPK